MDFLSAPLTSTSWSTIALCLASLFRITACISTLFLFINFLLASIKASEISSVEISVAPDCFNLLISIYNFLLLPFILNLSAPFDNVYAETY